MTIFTTLLILLHLHPNWTAVVDNIGGRPSSEHPLGCSSYLPVLSIAPIPPLLIHTECHTFVQIVNEDVKSDETPVMPHLENLPMIWCGAISHYTMFALNQPF